MKHIALPLLLLAMTFSPSLYAQVMVETLTNEFPGSGGVKIGGDGKVYIGNFGDALNNPNGTQVWAYDVYTDSLQVVATGFSGASGNDFDSKGNFFQSNISANTVSKVDSNGNVSTFASTNINGPVGIAIDAKDNLFVCNCSSHTIAKIDSNGISTIFSSSPWLFCPNGITIGPFGNLYVSNFNNGRVIVLDSLGNASIFATVPGNNNGHITYSPADSVFYVASHGSSKIYEMNLFGDLRVLAGSGVRGNLDGPGDLATFSRPNGIAATATGDTLFVNSSVPLVNTNGGPLNPSLLRMVTGVKSLLTNTSGYEFGIDFQAYPLGGLLMIQTKSAKMGEGLLRVIDLNGQVLYSEMVNIPFGEGRMELSLNGMPGGLYVIDLVVDGKGLSRRVFIP